MILDFFVDKPNHLLHFFGKSLVASPKNFAPVRVLHTTKGRRIHQPIINTINENIYIITTLILLGMDSCDY